MEKKLNDQIIVNEQSNHATEDLIKRLDMLMGKKKNNFFKFFYFKFFLFLFFLEKFNQEKSKKENAIHSIKESNQNLKEKISQLLKDTQKLESEYKQMESQTNLKYVNKN